jgi:hypothetical protein
LAPVQEARLPPESGTTPAPAAAPAAPTSNVTDTPSVPTLPNPLVDLLSTAGMAGVVPVSLDHIPAEKRPANFAWKYGAVFGGVIEVDVLDDRDLDTLSNTYLDFLKSNCTGKFTSSLGPLESLREITMRTGDATCTAGEQTTYFRHVYYVNRARILTLNQKRDFMILIHEGVDQTKDMATKARDLLATAVRQIATVGLIAR